MFLYFLLLLTNLTYIKLLKDIYDLHKKIKESYVLKIMFLIQNEII